MSRAQRGGQALGFQALQAFLGDARQAGVKLGHACCRALLLPPRELLEVVSVGGFASVLLCQAEAFVYAEILDIRGDLKKEVCARGLLNGGFGVCVDFADVDGALSYCYVLA